MNSLKFLRNAIVYMQTGINPLDRVFFRITSRNKDTIRLKELFSAEVDGKRIPGGVNPAGECFWRKVKNVNGVEYGAPHSIGNVNGWLRLFRKPKGGKRQGAGRPKGGGKGRTQISRSICLSKAEWELFDQLRGRKSRGRFIAKMLETSGLKLS